jgi:hypothetical protein
MTQLSSTASRLLFAAAVVMAGFAVLEKLANFAGYTLTFLGNYGPSRLLELAAVALLFVIAMQLREIKEAGRGPSAG